MVTNAIPKFATHLPSGIIEFDETGGEMKIVRRPKGDTRPSRYSLTLREIMRQGIPDFGMA